MDVGQWIRVDQVVNISPDLESDNWYSSKILEILAQSLLLSVPQRKSVFLRLQKNQKIRLSIPANKGLFLSTCLVREVRPEKPSTVEVELPQEVVLVERRRFQRLPSRMEVFYSEIRDRGRERGLVFQKAFSLDISGGGMRLELHRTFPQETLLHLKFSLPIDGRNETFLLTGRIVRTLPVQEGIAGQAGIEFVDISGLEQEAISRFVGDKLKSIPAG
jgi:c-di-GMP-binding flagellar brake protein YcgR